MGISPTTFVEIKAYSDLIGIEFTPTEVLTLIEMSRAYVNQSHDRNPRSRAPHSE